MATLHGLPLLFQTHPHKKKTSKKKITENSFSNNKDQMNSKVKTQFLA
jgi:hypothetical protein